MISFEDYGGDPEHDELVELGLAIPLDDPQPMPEDVCERPNFDAWERLWRRRHPEETSGMG